MCAVVVAGLIVAGLLGEPLSSFQAGAFPGVPVERVKGACCACTGTDGGAGAREWQNGSVANGLGRQ